MEDLLGAKSMAGASCFSSFRTFFPGPIWKARRGMHRKWQQPLNRDFIGEGRFGEKFYSLLLVKLCEGGDEREGKGIFPFCR